MTQKIRTRWVIGNWKMNGNLAANATLLAALKAAATPNCKLAVCAPSPYLAQLQSSLAGTSIAYGGQDVSEHASGAYTGQVSAAMQREFGATVVLVGHSERRHGLGESNELVARKARAALAGGLLPVVCVGELLAEREAGKAEATVLAQLNAVAELLGQDLARCVVAYEPVWAIGTGKTASPADAQAMHAAIRVFLRSQGAGDVPVLYGGSVKPSNAAELFAMPDIDGGLIGGASLVAADFLGIAAAA